jgi:hypothetical protein
MLNLASDGLLSFSKAPARLALLVGALVLLLGVVFGSYALVHAALAPASAPGGWGAVLTAVLVVGGCVLGAVGIVGEYVARVYEQVKGRPIYLLKEASPALLARPTGLDEPSPSPYQTWPAEALTQDRPRRVG